jgi:hypothetical protein
MNQYSNDDTSSFPGKLLALALILMLAIAGFLTFGGDLGGTTNLIHGQDVNGSPYPDDRPSGAEEGRGGNDRRLRFPIHRNKSVWRSSDDGRVAPRGDFDSYSR